MRRDEQDEEKNDDMVNVNQLMSLLDDKLQNELKDNVLYYIAAFTVKPLLRKLECDHFKDKLLLDVEDDKVFQMATYPVCKTNLLHTDTKLGISFTCCVENCKGHRNGIQTKGNRRRKGDQLQPGSRPENTISSS